MSEPIPIHVYFSDVFLANPATVAAYGAFNVSLVRDLPLFIDPFLLYQSGKPEYRTLHDDMLRYVAFLRDKTAAGGLSDGHLLEWFMFPEVKQTWLGFSRDSNRGRGLGPEFAGELRDKLVLAFPNGVRPQGARGAHLEKVSLLSEQVGKDNISDFTTNLIKPYLLEFTQAFARQHLKAPQRRLVHVPKVRFDYGAELWTSGQYELPYAPGLNGRRSDYVILTPLDMLTKDDNWINKTDLIDDLPEVIKAVSNAQLRVRLERHFDAKLREIVERDADAREKARAARRSDRAAARAARRAARVRRSAPPPSAKQRNEAARDTVHAHPQVLDQYILFKEDRGAEAEQQSGARVQSSERLYIEQVRDLVRLLLAQTDFYNADGGTLEGARRRVRALRTVVEGGGGAKCLYADGEPISSQEDLGIVARLTWLAAPGAARSPGAEPLVLRAQDTVDSGDQASDRAGDTPRARFDPAVVRFSLATNSKLQQLLEKRRGPKTPDAAPVLAIVGYSASDAARVREIRRDLDLAGDDDIIVVTAR